MPSVFVVSPVAISFASPLKKQKEKKKNPKTMKSKRRKRKRRTPRTSSFASYRRLDSTAGRATTPGLTCRSMSIRDTKETRCNVNLQLRLLLKPTLSQTRKRRLVGVAKRDNDGKLDAFSSHGRKRNWNRTSRAEDNQWAGALKKNRDSARWET